METATASFRSCLSSGFRSSNVRLGGVIRSNLLRFGSTSVASAPAIKLGGVLGQRRMPLNNRRCSAIRASLSSSDSGNPNVPIVPIAPLPLESPVGQFLAQILVSHPHLVPAAVEQQLEQLRSDRDAEKRKEGDPSAPGTDLVLYRRIAEVKANERRKALEEILYALVIQKFMDANVLLVPSLASSSSDPSGRVDTWNTEVENLEKLHSSEAYEMIQNHLSLILGNRLGDSNSVAEISKLRVGQVYAASVMYGYFLKRVDQRFRLEQTMKILPEGFGDEEPTSIQQTMDHQPRQDIGVATSQRVQKNQFDDGGDIRPGGFDYATKSSRLRTYVMSFDIETLQRYATIRSKEAVTIVEKHTEALFGRPEIVITPMGTIDSSTEELIKISCGGLRRLVLEAVTFGSILWDVESFVDSRYHFVAS